MTRQRKRTLSFWRRQIVERQISGETNGRKGLVRFVCVDSFSVLDHPDHLCRYGCYFLLVQEVGSRWPSSQKEFLFCFQVDRGKPEACCLFFFTCLQLKMILMPEWHILGWHILLPFPSLQRWLGLLLSRVLGSGTIKSFSRSFVFGWQIRKESI